MFAFKIFTTLLLTVSQIASKEIFLAKFDGSNLEKNFTQMNDPVMGGKSTGKFSVENNFGIMDG